MEDKIQELIDQMAKLKPGSKQYTKILRQYIAIIHELNKEIGE